MTFKWEDFLKGRYAVYFRSDESCERFLKQAESLGCNMWYSKTKLSEITPSAKSRYVMYDFKYRGLAGLLRDDKAKMQVCYTD